MTMPYANITSLYKYRMIDDRTIEGLRSQKLWVARPDSFDDPFDFNTDNWLEEIDPETIEILSKQGEPWLKDIEFGDPTNREQLIKNMKSSFQSMKEKWGVICFTENCESTLMLSQYADCHRGLCMEFERTADSVLGDYNVTKPVTYSSHCPLIIPKNLYHESDLAAFTRQMTELAVVKAAEWSYQREWRMLSTRGNYLEDYPGKLKSIIWGMRTTEPDKAKVKDSLKGSVEFKKAKRLPGEFRIDIEME